MSYLCDGDEAKVLAKAIKNFRDTRGLNYRDFGIEFNGNPFTISFWLLDNKQKIAGFTLTQQVNCCGLLVSTGTFVNEKWRGQGIAQEMLYLKEELAKQFGYSSMIATVNMTGNPAEVHILEKFGWHCNNSFVNSRTKNTVGVFTKNL